MRLLFVARAIDRMAGGVERMIVTIMNAMVARGHEVALFTWDRAGAECFYPMSPAIAWYRLDRGEAARKAGPVERLRRAAVVRNIVRRFGPDVITCFQGGPFMAMRAFTLGMGIPLVAAERTAPTLYEHAGTSQHRLVEHLMFHTAALVTVQVERYRLLYPRSLRKKIVAIPNPVAPAGALAKPAAAGPDGRFRLLSVGRLSYQKNYPVLLDAFEAIAETAPQWDLCIVGEGEDRQPLEARIAASGRLRGRVTLAGAQKDVGLWYRSAHLFCLPSRWEGFPNALAEALAHGLPAVGFSGCAGVCDLIDDGRTGFLAAGNGDAATLAAALLRGTTSAERGAMGEAAVAAMRSFAPDTVFDLWERTLAGVARR